MELFTRVSGWVIRSMAMEFRFGLTEPVTRGIGRITRHAARVNSGTWMAMCSRASGRMTRPMAMAYTCT